MFCLACMSVYHRYAVPRRSKRVLDFLKWELEIVASCHMSVRNRSRVLSKEQPVIFIVRHLSSLDRHFFVIHCLHKLNSEFQFESSHVLNSILP